MITTLSPRWVCGGMLLWVLFGFQGWAQETTETLPEQIAPSDDLGLFETPSAPVPESPSLTPTLPPSEAAPHMQDEPQASQAATPIPGDQAAQDIFDVEPTGPQPGVSESASESEIRAKLDLPEGVYEDIKKDPFSYLGNIRYEDIYVIQKMYARKQGRVAVSAFGGGGNFFSQFHTSLANGFGAGFYFSDLFGWEIIHGLITHAFTNNRHEWFLKQFELWSGRLEFRLNAALSSALILSPFYGKFSFFGVRVMHYDLYFLLGPAVTIYEEKTLGFGAIAGLGFRVFLNKWSSLGLEFRDYVYLEQIPDTIVAATGLSAASIASKFFLFLNLTVYFPKFAFMDEI